MPDYSAQFYRHGGYSFDERSVYELAEQVKTFSGLDAEVEAKLIGGHTLTSKNVKELVTDAFFRSNLIEQLVIKAWNMDLTPHRSIQIILRDRPMFEAVNVSISGDRQASIAARAEIDSIIAGQRQWYARLHLPFLWYLPVQMVFYLMIGVGCGFVASTYWPGS
jgi:hypothetical protein